VTAVQVMQWAERRKAPYRRIAGALNAMAALVEWRTLAMSLGDANGNWALDVVWSRHRMTKTGISAGVVHEVPTDLRDVLVSDEAALAKWEDITPLARNEWICWIESVKKPETRRKHVERTRTELKEGKRRPCCWPGCRHR
jgi:hypothetical protein